MVKIIPVVKRSDGKFSVTKPKGQKVTKFITYEKSGGDKYKQTNSGLMAGRKEVKGEGDGLGVIRADKDFIYTRNYTDRKNHIRHLPNKKIKSGEILGRW